MNRISVILLLFLQCFQIEAQKNPADSLENLLNTVKSDTGKINILNELGRELISEGNFPKADSISYLAVKFAHIADFKSGEAAAYRNLGKIAEDQGSYSEALKNLQQSLNICQEIGNKKGISQSNLNIANIYEAQGNYPQALAFDLKALKIIEDIGYKSGEGRAELSIGSIYTYQNNFDEALEHYMRGLKIFQELKDTEELGNTYDCIGGLYFNEHKYQEALDYMSLSLKIAQREHDKQGLSYAYSNLGAAYEGAGNYEEALKNFLKAAKISEEIGDKHGVAGAYVNIGDNFTKQKKYAEAKIWLMKALGMGKIVGSKDILKIVYTNLTNADSLLGDYKSSIRDYEMYIIYRDSLKNAENTRKIVSEQMTYEFNKKQDSINTAEDKKEAAVKSATDKKEEKQKFFRNMLLAGLLFALIFAVVFFIQRQRISIEKRRSEELLLNILPLETALELKVKGSAPAKDFEMVTVLFTDFINFTRTSENLKAQELVNHIHYYYSEFDRIIAKHGIEKIKTIGDGYMAAGGLPVPNSTNPFDTVKAALEIKKFMDIDKLSRLKEGKDIFELRIGIHTGPVVAGIVGIKKFAYDIWGDTVNIASRIESSGEAGKVNISGATYQIVKDKFTCVHRGKIQAKNKGEIDMYFVEG
jgi:adenylate cyclase